jgi:2-polyprenyl-6-hydroxyphenyl methylase/3-demethylubiquinone-9 3-methyltransferase
MAPLHALNAARVRYVRDRACAHFGRDAEGERPLRGLRVLDVGCGAGLLAEPLTRLGARVTGVDASAAAVAAARRHAEGVGLAIDYRAGDVAGVRDAAFDIVVAMEVVEHVPDLDAFVASVIAHLQPQGLFLAATLNRTPKAFALAIVGAEYLLRWLPRGTHDWQKFVRPSELSRALRVQGLQVGDVTGATFDAATATFALSRDVGVNYLLSATR